MLRISVATALLLAAGSVLPSAAVAATPSGVAFSTATTASLEFNWNLESPGQTPIYALSTVSNFSTTLSSQTGAPGQENVSFGSLSKNTTYYFKVKVSTESDAAYSATLATATLAGIPIANPSVTLSSGDITVSWNHNGNPAGTRYSGELSVDADFSSPLELPFQPVTSVTISDLDGNTTYYFRVRATNHYGAYTDYLILPAAITHSSPPVAQPVSGVLNDRLTANWLTDSSQDTQYLAELSTAAGFTGGADLNSGWIASINQYEFTGLATGTQYFTRVKSRGLDGFESVYATLPTTTTLAFPTTQPPSNIVFTTASPISLDVAWTMQNPNEAPFFALSTDAAFTAVVSSLTGGVNQSSHVFTGLSVDTTYHFRIKVSTANDFFYSVVYDTGTGTFPPVASPSVALSSSDIRVSWTANGNPGGTLYQVAVFDDPIFFNFIGATDLLTATFFDLPGLSPSTTYYFLATSVNHYGVESATTPLPPLATLAEPPNPQQPEDVLDTSMRVRWDPLSNPLWTEFRAQLSTAANFSGSADQDSGFLAGTSSFTFQNLGLDTTYYSRVNARNPAGVETAFVALPTTTTFDAPAALPPTGVFFPDISSDTISVSWTLGSPGQAPLYALSVSSDFASTVSSTTLAIGAQSITVSNLGVNTSHYFRVKVSTVSDLFYGQTEVVVTSATPPVPDASIALSSYQIRAQWQHGLNPPDTRYLGELSTFADFFETLLASEFENVLSLDVPGLNPNTTYYLRVKAHNHAEVETSTVALPSAITLAEEPFSPVLGTVLDTSFELSWSTGDNPVGTEFFAAVSTASDFTGSADTDSSWIASASSFTFSSLSLNTTYYARVKARNFDHVETAFTSEVSTVTLPYAAILPPTGISFTEASTGSVVAGWTLRSPGEAPTYAFSAFSDFSTTVSSTTGPAGLNSAAATGLPPNTTFYFKIKVSTAVDELYSQTLATATYAQIPVSSPTVILSSTAFTARWGVGANPPGTEYSGEVATDFLFNSVIAESPWDTETSITADSLDPNTTYYLRVRAKNRYEVTTASVPLPTAVTFAARPAGAPPTGVYGRRLTLHWAPGSNPAGTSYSAELSEDTGFLTGLQTSPFEVDRSSFQFGGLSLDTTYYARVRARNHAGVPGAFVILVSTKTLPFDEVLPPENITLATRTADSLGYSWTMLSPFERPLIAFASDSAFTTVLSSDTGEVNQSSHVLSGLSVNTSYFFRVKVSSASDFFWSVVFETATAATEPSPAATTVVSSEVIRGSWGRNGSPVGTQYFAQWAIDPDFATVQQVSPWTSATSFDAPALNVNTTYYIRVRGRNLGGVETSTTALPSACTHAAPPVKTSSPGGSDTTMVLAWGPGSNPGGTPFLPELAIDAGFTVPIQVGWITANTTNFTGLSPNTTYYTRVRARNCDAVETAIIALETTATAASAPASAAVTGISSSALAANWTTNGNPGGTEFSAELALDASFGTGYSSTPFSAVLASTFTGLSANTTYYLRARARNHAGIETATTALGPQATDADVPVSAAATIVTNSQITANWTAGGNPAGTEYHVERATDSSFGGSLDASNWITATQHTFLDLTGNTSYYFRVQARGHNGTVSAWVALPTTLTEPGEPIPLAPQKVFGSLFRAHWLTGNNAPGTEFFAERATDTGFSTGLADSGWQADLSSFTFTALALDTTYYTRVKARNSAFSESGFIVLPSTKTLNFFETLPPTGILLDTATASSLDAAWVLDNPTQAPFYMLSTDAAFAAIVSSETGPVAQSSVTFSALSPNTTHYFRIKVSTANDLFFSDSFSTSTLANPPAAAGTLALSSADVAGSWSANGNPPGTRFLAERALDSLFSTGLADGGWTTETTSTFTALAPNTTYYLRVRARSHSAVDTSSVSLGSAITFAAPPGADAITALSSADVHVSWSTGTNPTGTEFFVEISSNAGFSPLSGSSGWADFRSATFTALLPDTLYYARAKTRNALALETAYGSLGSTRTPSTPPTALTPDPVLSRSLTVHWGTGANPPTTQYFADLSTATDFTGGLDQFSGWVSGESHEFTALTLNTTYYTRVKARNGDLAETSYAALPSTMTLSFEETLPPTNIRFTTASPVSLDAAWNLLNPIEAPLYVLSLAADFSTTISSQAGIPGQENVSFSGLSVNTTHYFKVKVTTAPDLFYSLTVTTATEARPPVSADSVVLSSSDLRADWAAGGNPAQTLFLAEAATDGAFTANLASGAWTTGFSSTLTALSPNTTYFLRVRARNHYGHETTNAAAPVAVTLAAPPAFANPSSVFSSSLAVNWSSGGNPAGTEFLTERSTDSAFGGTLVDSGWTTGVSSTFTALTPNSTYYFRTRARNHSGVSTANTSLPATLTRAEPPGPGALSGVFDTLLTAHWTRGANPPGTQFLAELSTAADFSGNSDQDTGWVADASSRVFSGLSLATTYYLRAKARNFEAIETEYQTLGSTATLPYLATLPPSAVVFATASASSLDAVWTLDNAGQTPFYALSKTDDFAVTAASTIGSLAQSSVSFSGLERNTTYYFKIKVSTAIDLFYSAPIATPTWAGPPVSAASVALSSVSLAPQWLSGGNPAGTEFLPEAALDSLFSSGLSSNGWTTATASTFPALTVNTTYYLRVRARNWAGIETSTVALPAIATDPVPPVSAAPVVLSSSDLRGEWGGGGNPAESLFQAGISTAADFSTASTNAWTSLTTSTFTGLSVNTTYFVRVQAIGHNGSLTAFTQTSTGVTHADLPSSGIPAAVSSTSLRAAWTAGTNPAGTQFAAELAGDPTFSTGLTDGGWTIGLASTFTTLSPNTTYYLRVRARSHASVETARVEVSSTPTLAATPVAGNATPLSTGSLSASWGADGNPAGTEFLAEASTDAVYGAIASSGSWAPGTVSTFTSLSPNTTHYVRVRARNFAGFETSTAAAAVGVTFARIPLLAQPVVLSSADAAAVWDPDSNPSSTLFFAQAALDSGFSSGVASSGWLTGTASTFSALTPNTTYYFQVKARSHDGTETGYAALPATMTYAEPPGALPPERVFGSQLTVGWSALSNPAGTEFSAEVSTASDFTGTPGVSPWTVFSSHTFTGLLTSTTYYARVRARDGGHRPSAYTALPSTITLSGETLPPTNIRFDTATASTLDASWVLDNASQTPFYALSLSSDFSTPVSSTIGSVAQSSASLGGLSPNTTYWFTVKVSTAPDLFYSVPVATPTHAAPPGAGVPAALSSTSIQAAWTAAANPGDTAYFPEAALDSGYTSGVVSGSWTTALAQTFSGLSADATYYLRVRAINRAGIETATTSLPETATLAAPPVSAAASNQSSTTVRANWGSGANTAPTSFVHEISTSAAFTGLTASSRTLNAYADYSGLIANTRYYSRVRALSHAETASADVNLPDAVTLATAPTGAAMVNVLSQSIAISWNGNGNPDGTEYFAERATDSGFSANTGNSGWIAQTTVTLTGLTQQTTYYFRVKARNLELVQTDYLVFPSTPTGATPPTPAAVALFAVSVSSLSASWQLLIPGATPFYALSTRSDFATTVSSQAGAADQESAAFSGLAANTTFYFKVKFNTAGDSGYTTPLSTITLAAVPGAPTQGDASASELTARWSASGNGPGTVYTFEFDDDPAFGSIDASSTTLNSSATVTGLLGNSRYYGRVRALGHRGDLTVNSSTGALATLAHPPTAAAASFVTVTFTSVTARWTPLPLSPSSATAQGYVLEASTASDFSGTLSSTSLLASTDTLAVGGLNNGTTYYLRVGSLNLDLSPHYLSLGSTRTLPAGTTSQTVQTGLPFTVSVSPSDPEITTLTVDVPANALPPGTTVTINTGVSFFLPPPQSNQLSLIPVGGGAGVEIDAGGAQPTKPVAIRIVYDPAALPAGRDPKSLIMARYDTVSAQWTLLPTTVEPGIRTVTGWTDHFSLFAPFFGVAATAFDAVQIFPVPWEPGSGGSFDAQRITFAKLPAGTEVRILSIHGEDLVKLTAPASGVVSWDGLNGSGYPVASGTYLVRFKSGGAHAVRRVVVIR